MANDTARAAYVIARRRLAEAFTPARPLSGAKVAPEQRDGTGWFIGRNAELDRIFRALSEDRAHVVIYGDRGRGKTSLANFVVAKAPTINFAVARYVCSAASDFDAILRGLFRDVSQQLGISFGSAARNRLDAEPPWPTHRLQPVDLLTLSGLPGGFRLLLMIDEFDRVLDEAARTAIADMIKQCSDRDAPVSFMVIGVSDSAEELLGRHPSIQRCVTRVRLPLLSNEAVEHIVAQGAAFAGLHFPTAARTSIAELARGVPYVAQLLSLRAGQAALQRQRLDVRSGDLIAAIVAAVAEADPRVTSIYQTLTASERDTAVMELMRSAAAGRQDEFGRFTVRREGRLLRVAGTPADPAAWQRAFNAGVIRPSHADDADRFTFSEPMLPHLVLQRAVLLRTIPKISGKTFQAPLFDEGPRSSFYQHPDAPPAFT